MRPLALAVLLLPATALGNLRAPLVVVEPGSSALAPAEGVTVHGERLSFACDAVHACEVTAVYRLESAAAQEVSLAFVSPDEAKLRVRLGETALEVPRTVPLGADVVWQLEDRGAALPRRTGRRLHEARFRIALPAGRSELEVRYLQPLSLEERGHGYFTDGDLYRSFAYELWPLRGWTLADGFAIELRVAVQDAPRGLGARLFGTGNGLRCEGLPAGGDLGEARHDGERLVLEARLGASFPDRLRCESGPR